MRKDDLQFDADRAAEFRRAGFWNDDTLWSWLEGHAAQRPDHPAIVGGGEPVTYRELADRVRALASGLAGLGLGKGDVVAAQLPNVAEFIVSYGAVTAIGGVFLAVHLPYRVKDLEFLLGHGEARAFICLSAMKDFAPAQAALDLKAQLPSLDHVIAVGAGRPAGSHDYARLAEGDPSTAIVDPPDAADPCLLLYTSGTTTNPKGAPHNYHTMLGSVRATAHELGMSADDTVLTISRYSHMWGISCLTMALYVGGTNLLMADFTPEVFALTVETERPKLATA